MKLSLPLAAALLMTELGMTGCTAPSDTTTATATTTMPKHSATIPSSFQGTWTDNPSGLHPPGGEEPWVLSAKTIEAHETYGVVRSVTIHGDNAITVIQDVDTEGEGPEFTDEDYFELSTDGNRLEMIWTEGGSLMLYRVR